MSSPIAGNESFSTVGNAVGQFNVLNTSELDVAGDAFINGKLNGGFKTGYVTGYISASVLADLTVDGGFASNNSRAFRTTSGAADLSTTLWADLTDAEKGTLLTLPYGAIPTGALLCKTGSTSFASAGGTAELSIVVTDNYNPTAGPDSAGTPVIGAIYTQTTIDLLNNSTTVSGSDTGPITVIVPNADLAVDTGGAGSQGGLTESSTTNVVVAGVDTQVFSATDELKIRINYIIVPTSTEFLSDNY